MTNDELLARVEGLVGPDHFLDRDLFMFERGYSRIDIDSDSTGDRTYAWKGDTFAGEITDTPIPPYTASIDAALALKDRLLPGQAAAMGDMAFTAHPRGPWATIWTLAGEPKWNAEAPTLPLAIIIATLRARAKSGDGQ